MDGPAERSLGVASVVGAGPAIERRSVMRRRLFNFAAALSLVLFVATAALWVSSYWGAGGVIIAHRCGLSASKGTLPVAFQSTPLALRYTIFDGDIADADC